MGAKKREQREKLLEQERDELNTVKAQLASLNPIIDLFKVYDCVLKENISTVEMNVPFEIFQLIYEYLHVLDHKKMKKISKWFLKQHLLSKSQEHYNLMKNIRIPYKIQHEWQSHSEGEMTCVKFNLVNVNFEKVTENLKNNEIKVFSTKKTSLQFLNHVFFKEMVINGRCAHQELTAFEPYVNALFKLFDQVTICLFVPKSRKESVLFLVNFNESVCISISKEMYYY